MKEINLKIGIGGPGDKLPSGADDPGILPFSARLSWVTFLNY
jgi:hypothetical protein